MPKTGPRSIRHIVSAYTHEVGIAGVSTHTLRRTCATYHDRKGTEFDTMRWALGYESLATTCIDVRLPC
jgi:site-specific recombinase XerD